MIDQIYPGIDFRDLIPGSAYFRWSEALFLREWNVFVHPSIEVAQNIIKTAKSMEAIRGRLGAKPLQIKSWYRPPTYNSFIKGAPDSQHILGLACDFSHPLITADEIREDLLPELPRLRIRMEDLPMGSSWCHIDLKSVTSSDLRFFKP